VLLLFSIAIQFYADYTATPESAEAEFHAQIAAIAAGHWAYQHFAIYVALSWGLVLLHIVGVVGMFLFRPWGRTLSFFLTAAALVLLPFVPPSAASQATIPIDLLSEYLWGAILALAYFSPVSNLFSANNSLKPEQT
jgi:hypothetical protein